MWLSFAKALAILPNGHLRLYPIAMDSNSKVRNQDTVFTMSVALTKEGAGLSPGGYMPDIRVWNAECDYEQGITTNDDERAEAGEIFEVKVTSVRAQQMPFALFTANVDAICVATIGVTMVDESAYYWIGDWARECHRDWFYSNIYIQGTDHKTKCQWIDKNHDRSETGFSIHFPSFTMLKEDMPKTEDGEKRLKDFICKEAYRGYIDDDPRSMICDKKIHKPGFLPDDFSAYDKDVSGNPIDHWNAPPDGNVGPGFAPNRAGPNSRKPPRRRGLPEDHHYRKNTHDDWLVVTDDPDHSALELCTHVRSKGPNLVNTLEGNYCHMVDKTLWPVCSNETADDCFDADSQKLFVQGIQARGVQFNKVLDWSEGAKRRR